MALLAFALVLTGLLQWSLSCRDFGTRQCCAKSSGLAATASIFAWCGVIAGRWIAYTH